MICFARKRLALKIFTMIYQSHRSPYSGSAYEALVAQARYDYHVIQKLTPRREAYVRAKYFKKEKVFIDPFWQHLQQKPSRDRRRRLKLFACAIDLIRNSVESPTSIKRRKFKPEILYRFTGQTLNGTRYYVQVKENAKSGRKEFVSVFPKQK